MPRQTFPANRIIVARRPAAERVGLRRRGDIVVRYIQNILLVIGAPALGVVSCGVGLASLAEVTVFRTRPGQDPSLDWGGAVGFLGCGFCGGTFGAIAGLVGAGRWIARRGREPWRPITWVGVALGLAAALTVRFSGVLDHHGVGDLIRRWPGTALFVAASGTLGGLIGGFAGARRKRERKPRGKNRQRF